MVHNKKSTNLDIRPTSVTQQTETLRYRSACYVQVAIQFLNGDGDINTDILKQTLWRIDKSVDNLGLYHSVKT